ncbi:hypothetical protein K435DRAFT_972377 [Dendrothele bispora CBS 962.96]|uniref:Uncharacterized protein n=1 Tax=Dendrothele bispora (strain CBS 962.96) TaxID=1314807 RepID=A0A4S8KZ87_DENBC|nr:hypothetical protein K435DRAFT_972377 [Dendrothele bispora CBS 962.96]
MDNNVAINNSLDDAFPEFHRRWWGSQDLKNGSEEIIISRDFARASLQFLNLVPGDEDIRVYVRDEYKNAYKYLEQVEKGAVVLGSPGIGKSVFIIYALARRLEAMKPTILVTRSGTTLVFSREGVSVADPNTGRVGQRDAPCDCWVLHDSTLRGVPKPWVLAYFLVFPVSPGQERYKELKNQTSMGRYYMNPWEPEELCKYFGGPLQQDSYDHSGPIIRDYIRCQQGEGLSDFKTDIAVALLEAEWEDTDRMGTNPFSVCHTLFVVRRDDDPGNELHCTYDFRSVYVKRKFLEGMPLPEDKKGRAQIWALRRSSGIAEELF